MKNILRACYDFVKLTFIKCSTGADAVPQKTTREIEVEKFITHRC